MTRIAPHLLICFGLLLTGCIKNRSQNPEQGPVTDQGQRTPVGQSPQSQAGDYKTVSMNIARDSLAKTELNVADLKYEMSFKTEAGDTLAEVPSTKLEYDEATSKATVSMQVKIGSEGRVHMAVTDGETDYAGKSELLTISGDTKTSVALKKVDGGGNGNQDTSVTITATIDDSGSQPNPPNPDPNRNNPTPPTPDPDPGTPDPDPSTSGVSYKRYAGTPTEATYIAWLNAHRDKLPEADKAFYKYAYVDQEFYQDEAKANIARVALFKALNHVAMGQKEIYVGEDASDGNGMLFAFDVRKIFGAANAEAKWRLVSGADTRGVSGMISAPQYGRLKRFKYSNLEAVSRVVYNLLSPGVYVQLLDTPAFERGLRQEKGFPNKTCKGWTAQKNAIVYGSRVSCYRETSTGKAYWATSDDFDGREGEPIPHMRGRVAPQFRGDGMVGRPDAGTIASEAWLEMENGFIAYYIWGNANQRRGRAELFVEDPENVSAGFNFKYLETGRSCITCHTQGPQAAPSDMATAIEDGTFTGQRLAEAKKYWTSNAELNTYYAKSRTPFVAAMKKLVDSLSDGDKNLNRKLTQGGTEPILMVLKVIDRTR